MLYEIMNPSDPYTIEAGEFDVAAVACLLLGNGQYGFRPLTPGAPAVPILFGGAPAWSLEQFGKGVQALVEDVLAHKREALATCLDSCLIGNEKDRAEYGLAIRCMEVERREGFKLARHDRRRTSMNDIGGRAAEIARKLRAHDDAALPTAPRQVFGR